jgi:PiT family inorganic phosphate transporter
MVLPPRAMALRGLHILSSGAVSFARGLNDTPKIAAVLLPIAVLGKPGAIVTVALAMGLGGWFLAKGVTTTMSRNITDLEGREPEALAGNLSTAFLVLLASRWGVPVSTTHVATGALVGAGAARGEFRMSTLSRILLAWVTTLPLAAALAAGLALALGGWK